MMRQVESVWILKTDFGKAEAPNPKVLKTGQSQPQLCCSRFKWVMTDTGIEKIVFIWSVLDIESKLKDCLYCFRTWDLTAGHHRPLLCKLLNTPPFWKSSIISVFSGLVKEHLLTLNIRLLYFFPQYYLIWLADNLYLQILMLLSNLRDQVWSFWLCSGGFLIYSKTNWTSFEQLSNCTISVQISYNSLFYTFPALFNTKNKHYFSFHRSLCFSFPFLGVVYSFLCYMHTFG